MERDGGHKQTSHKTPYTQLEQVSSDFFLAIGLQEQNATIFTALAATLESEGSSSSLDNEQEDDDNADFFTSYQFETEDLQFLESEGSNYGDDEGMDDFDFDVDELTYEELIELEDFIAKQKRGLSANEVSSCLHSYTFDSVNERKSSGTDRCVICQIEYEEGEALVALRCGHPFHTDCISKWLQVRKVCPICSSEISAPEIVNKQEPFIV
ncbi:hypothetical protein HN51_059112 [Arachis hypogaea]|uniref:E3 ubiquitin ligase BIG BROTHER-related-like n=1 Tax=Arachis ipaensis TaxID=130454 RepID=UPI0007AEEE14|nr:E3 ubiquitin ligase BIG BROTHER-related-like [Arachis ipaensis]XP_025682757.1 E3 ubiquitin ligase BIG BROTHER-related-like [Arachis hypogaea]QHN82487.1 E3 ubiquitin ligase BIG BROTHER [Arachis hypogaea]